MRQVVRAGLLAITAALFLLPASAYAQVGVISGQARDASGGALPGVTVEATSPQLIEKVRTATTDENGRYQITNLPAGNYEVTFTLSGFSPFKRSALVTSDTTTPVNGDLKIGGITDVVNVSAEAPVVDVANARQNIVFQGADIRDLPTQRNIPDMLLLVPGMQTTRGSAFGAPDLCLGGIGTFCNPNLTNFNSHASALDIVGENAGLNQGRIMIDGMVINSGSPNGITGLSGGYVADVANAQEVSFTLSGALGESETGGASINIVPRTGGNRFSGNFFTSYTANQMFDKNNGDRNNRDDNGTNPTTGAATGTGNDINVVVPVNYDYDVNGAFGGPILRDRLWFFANARNQGKEQVPTPGQPFYWNKNYGTWGMNYQPDRTQEPVVYRNEYRNVALRLTLQATQKNKFNIFWDEQDSCQDPCYGVVSVFTSPESWWSVQTRPNHLGQLTWNNPLTNRLLLEARLSAVMQHYDTTKHREIVNPRNIPRLTENGNTAGYDEVATRVNAFAGGPGFGLTSGSLNSGIEGGAETRNLDTYRTTASASYVTGSHNAKIGWEGGYFMERTTNEANDLRLSYTYSTPATTCAANNSCGNTSLYFPDDPNNTIARRPVPSSFDINTGEATIDERVWYGALYLQDQWTLNRFTLNGALRYDHSQSRYGETCVGLSGNEPYVPIQNGGQYAGLNYWCSVPSNGVSYNDLTPRWGVAWDVFGNGKTAVKWNMGKYLAGATIGGLYNNANPVRRSQNTMSRGWQDNNGNRMVDCRVFDFAAHSDLGDTCSAVTSNDANRFGRDPLALDASGLNNQFFQDMNCGESSPNPLLTEYCNRSGDNLMGGWGARNYNWQFGLGVQHELLPRLSVEVTYNRRYYGNMEQSDTLGLGCDRFDLGAQTELDCQNGFLNYRGAQYDFYSIDAPVDTRLPGGGGYRILGLSDEFQTGALPDNGEATAFDPDLSYAWNGIDTNFVLRARGGLRLSGGTSTGRSLRNTCYSTTDGPNVKGREGNEHGGGCDIWRPYQTNVRANASYTIPYIDLLVSTVFQYRPGQERSANLQINSGDVLWEEDAAERATAPCTVNNAAQEGCFYGAGGFSNTSNVNLLDFGDLYGEGVRIFDLKFAKNFRFANKRINVGVDVYNLFNSDAIDGYNNTYTAYRDADGQWQQGDNPATTQVEVQDWGRPTSLVSPRFLRFQVQFDF
jgi:hypothetical protein